VTSAVSIKARFHIGESRGVAAFLTDAPPD
jgi:hypothetical protein